MLASLTATSMPQTGSMAVSVERPTGGAARTGSGDSAGVASIAVARGLGDPAGLALRPQRDDLREDRERDLLRGLGADLESRRRVQPGALLLGKVEGLAHGAAANLAGDQGHVGDSRPKRLGEHPFLVVTV